MPFAEDHDMIQALAAKCPDHVSVKETSVCIVDDTGKIVREVKVASEPEALLAVLMEAGPLSQWLSSEQAYL